MTLAKRVAKLEKAEALTRDNRVVVRFAGPGSERLPQVTAKEIDDDRVLVVRFVAAKDGRPA